MFHSPGFSNGFLCLIRMFTYAFVNLTLIFSPVVILKNKFSMVVQLACCYIPNK